MTLYAASAPVAPDRPVDPQALAGEDGVLLAGAQLTLAGRGVAARLALPDGLAGSAGVAGLVASLAAVPHDDRVGRAGAKVTALGALPFDPATPGTLVVPELLYARDAEGRQWVTVVGPDRTATDELLATVPGLLAAADGSGAAVPATAPSLRAVTANPAGLGYAEAVRRALVTIAAGTLDKVVLARSVELAFDGPVPIGPAVRRLQAAEPTCTVFACPAGDGRFVGASPELLVRRRGTAVFSQPLAGTVALDAADPARERRRVEQFLASSKDRVEHELVVADIVATLRALCSQVEEPASPTLVRLHTVAHLGTPVRATLAGGPGAPSSLALVAALHPTPAVGGLPRAEALRRIAELEPMDRGLWAGPVGWVDATGDGEWMIGIRSATVRGPLVVCLAGAGIVAGSDPDAELAETTVKLVPVIEAFDPGAGPRL